MSEKIEIIMLGKLLCNDCGKDSELIHVCVKREYGANSYQNNINLCKECIEKRMVERNEN